MFRHKGKNRTYKHNVLLAALLSANAGLVNVTAVLSIAILTTNVTGHFAFFAEELTQGQYKLALKFLLFILSFLFGAFFSSLLNTYFEKKGNRNAHALSISIEIIILFFVGVIMYHFNKKISDHLVASILLFTMGMQNSLVTQISQSTVRTTHLTGLLTDLGIELSLVFSPIAKEEKNRIYKTINLRLIIISFFLIGGIAGGYLYNYIREATFIIASGILLFALLYDVLRLRFYKIIKRK